MPHIDSTQFGEIIIDNKRYHQVLIIGKTVKERDFEKLHALFNTSHKIGGWEIDDLLSNKPKIIIIGTGQNGAMAAPRQSDFQNRDGGKDVELIIAETPQAIEIYNTRIKSEKHINALIHTTC